MEWTVYRSRDIVYAKPFKNSKQEDCMRTKDGKVMPKESFTKRYEPLEEPPA